VDLRRFESDLLNQARSKWRFDHFSALEIFAQVRHYGGPTRLLDVTFNPLIALWFAVEKQFDEAGRELPDTDGRLFAFDVTEGEILLDQDWGGRELPWESPALTNSRRFTEEEPHWIWKPPSYNERISAQNSAFLIGRVPTEVELLWKYFIDSEFQSKLNSVPGIVSRVQGKINEFKESRPGISIGDKLVGDLDTVEAMIPDFAILSQIGDEVDAITWATQAMEARETGVIFTPRLLGMQDELDRMKAICSEFKDENGNAVDPKDAEFLAEGSDEELQSYDTFILEDSEITFHQLDDFKEAILDTQEFIANRLSTRKSSSIAMIMTKPDDPLPPSQFTTYTIRISATAKPEIRNFLERSYGYSASTLYPDIMGLAEKGPDSII
jgi:hypothetical protein